MPQNKQHYIWIDYMKVYGLYFIVLGHFFPSYSSYIYAFNVPLFFIVSGILSSKERDFNTFINKSIFNLIIPVFIIMVIIYIWDCLTHSEISFNIKSLSRFPNALIGMQGVNCGGGLGACWYIYTLFVLKFMWQILPKQILRILLVLLPITAVFLTKNGITPGNSIFSVTVAYPFFWFGIFLRQYIDKLNNINLNWKTFALTGINLFILIIVGRFNWIFYMYLNTYGRYLILAIIGGIAGTYVVYTMAILSERYFNTNKYLRTLSVGSIVILGFHNSIIMDFMRLHNVSINDYNVLLYSLLIMLLFIPINMFLEKYCPIIMGKRVHR